MTQVKKLWPLLTATHRYDKSLSTRGRGQGQIIDAPILAYLIETANGRILYDVGCDYNKIADKKLQQQYYDPEIFVFGAPEMDESQRLPAHLARMGLTPADVESFLSATCILTMPVVYAMCAELKYMCNRQKWMPHSAERISRISRMISLAHTRGK